MSTALSQRETGLPFEVRACDVVQQQVVFAIKQFSEPLLQMNLELLFVRQQSVESAAQTIVIDAVGVHARQIGQRGFGVPLSGELQFARRFQQATNDQNERRDVPADQFPPLWQRLVEKLPNEHARNLNSDHATARSAVSTTSCLKTQTAEFSIYHSKNTPNNFPAAELSSLAEEFGLARMVSREPSHAVGGEPENRKWGWFDPRDEGPGLIALRARCADLAAGVRFRPHVFRNAVSQNALTNGL